MIGAGLMLCGPAHAADDAAAICNAAISAYGAAGASGDPGKMAAVFAPDGELVSPYGFLAGHDALVKFYASFMKPGDKDVFTVASARMIGDVALCTGGITFKPASGARESKGFWTRVLGKVDDDWKLLNLTYAPAAPQ
ncbi:YybH family protein [Bradyrhizobium sp.]|uniref:YybH family protein n=1 Tax=Bradyrhizobium sp. TaxID=376 RepID=UPI003C4A58D3